MTYKMYGVKLQIWDILKVAILLRNLYYMYFTISKINKNHIVYYHTLEHL